MSKTKKLRVAELFAGVGGFRRGLEQAGPFEIVWSNQWEPGAREQFASSCYELRFETGEHVNDDIEKVLSRASDCHANGQKVIPDFDLLVGGFPCQDYSVAKPLNQAQGIEGKKGVLWWQIYRLLELKAKDGRAPRFVLLENVDRLLKSPGTQRGRDFAIILSCFARAGYDVEWRVINAAEYGFAQRRRRVFIFAQRKQKQRKNAVDMIFADGVLATAFPAQPKHFDSSAWLPGIEDVSVTNFEISPDPFKVTMTFGNNPEERFGNAGYMRENSVWTCDVEPCGNFAPITLGEVVAKTNEADVSQDFYVDGDKLEKWKYLKGAKNEPRVHKKSGTEYKYTEGALPFPDPLDRPARTILTGEGGSSPSRFKHIIQTPDGRYRRLIPEELEELNGFPRGWTNTGMSDIKRAFCMGNALVVGVVERIGRAIAEHADGKAASARTLSAAAHD